MPDLSVIIPARNEQFLARTVQDLLENIRADTDIIIVLDGTWANPPVPQHPKVSIIHHPESIGQRAAANEAVRISSSKYVMKCDAHCAFDEGFDVKLLADMQDDWTCAPTMRNLHIFNWVCPDGHTRYQGPSGPCKFNVNPDPEGESIECGKPTVMDIVWIPKTNPTSNSYCFDYEPHFAYFGEYSRRPEGKGDLTESMSLQGSSFMISRQRYLDLNICDEAFGSWGSQGIEVACKSWLSGGRVIINHKTWYAHCFRTQGGDFGFPYPLSGRQVEHAKKYAREQFYEGKWDKQVKPLSWLVEKFWPVKGWTEENLKELKEKENGRNRQELQKRVDVVRPERQSGEVSINYRDSGFDGNNIPNTYSGISVAMAGEVHNGKDNLEKLTKGIVYYTDNLLDPRIMKACQEQIKRCVNGHQIVSASLQPIDFGRNIVLPLERSSIAMFKQILAGLEASDADIIYFAEHDCLYHPSHFEFTPPRRDIFYYNVNVWKVDVQTGHALYCKDTRQTSGLCAYRELLFSHYRERVRRVELEGFSRRMGFEPGTHNRPERVDDYKSESWMSPMPNLDIRHDKNLTPSRWRKDQFRNQKYTEGWTEADCVEGWYEAGKFNELLKEIT